jgi:hypothetical protein
MSVRLTLILILCGALLTAGSLIYVKGRSAGIAQERPRTEAALDNAAARDMEAKGERQSAEKLAVIVRRQSEGSAALGLAIEQARSAPDATEKLSADRAARLRAADAQLCLGAQLRGCETSPTANAVTGG